MFYEYKNIWLFWTIPIDSRGNWQVQRANIHSEEKDNFVKQ